MPHMPLSTSFEVAYVQKSCTWGWTVGEMPTILDNRQGYIYPMDERGALIDVLVDWGQYVLVRGLVRRAMAPMGLGICVDKSNGSCVGWMMEL